MRSILTINGGSSSIKFALFAEALLERTMSGRIERIGEADSSLVVMRPGSPATRVPTSAPDHARAAEQLVDWLMRAGTPDLTAIGHRIVHGGADLTDHRRISPELIAELKRNQLLDLSHLPREIALIELMRERLPDVPQVACFDTAFHRDLPRVAQVLPIPRAYTDAGIRRLGFHGLSYAYLLAELGRVAGHDAAAGRLVLAHLGSGASLAAVHRGKPIDTTMAFTPTAGLVMGTRPGDLDPGLVVHLMRLSKLSPADADDLISNRCGLLGISGTTADMSNLLARLGNDLQAAEAVDVFCYQARKWVGAFAAALGGLDTLLFSGGIGEHSARVRRSICDGLEFLNLRLDAQRNDRHAPVISTDASAVTVRVMATDEEIMIARSVRSVLEEE